MKLDDAIAQMPWQLQLAFDLEFDRDRHTYGFDLCLMQVGFGNTCFIIDPLLIKNIQPVFGIFEDPKFQKLVHCPGEDLRLLHSLGCYPQHIADTEVMAKLLNYEHTSLSKLLETKLGIQLNKKQQQSNWHQRPLQKAQLKYAADDVLYIPDLYAILKSEIEKKGIWSWVQEEFLWLQTVKYTIEPKTNFLKPGDIRVLSPRQQYVLNEIFKLRDKLARIKNKPAFMIMPEQTVRDIALGRITRYVPSEMPGLHPAFRHGKAAEELSGNLHAIFEDAGKTNHETQSNARRQNDTEPQQNQKKRDMQLLLKNDFWAPIQQKLSEDYGTYTARYLLSNGWVNKWLNGEVKWKDIQPAYKQTLLKETCTSLGKDFSLVEAYEQTCIK